jgi:hypothetical protein
MRLPRFQFTIRRMIALIAACAILFSLVRTPAELFAMIVSIGLVLPGFVIDRARGGTGVMGGALSCCLLVHVLAIGLYLSLIGLPQSGGVSDLEFLIILSAMMVLPLSWGAAVSIVLYYIIKFTPYNFKKALTDESSPTMTDESWPPIDCHRLNNV